MLRASQSGNLSVLQTGVESTASLFTLLSSADGEESIDTTALRLRRTQTTDGFSFSLEDRQTLAVGPQETLHRRINLLSPLTFLLEVKAAGSYGIFEKTGSAAAGYIFQLFDDWMADNRTAAHVDAKAGGSIQLQAKIYVVTLTPTAATPDKPGAGILDFAIVPAGITDSASVLDAAPASPENALFWPRLDPADKADGQSLIAIARRGSVVLGGSTRALPLNLLQPALVKVSPGAVAEVDFGNDAPIRIFSTNPAFSPRTARIDGTPWAAESDIPAGTHRLSVSNTTVAEQWYMIGAVASASLAVFTTPRPAPLESLFPTFTEGSPIWRDFGSLELASFLLSVKEPASYRIATAGRLAMSVAIRTPLKTSLFSVSQNADGRNAVITSYLRPGSYLVQVRTQGASRGRAGILLQRQDAVNAGTLTEGAVLRTSVPSGALLRADVKISAEEDYRLECLGLGRSFSYRFEDADGWPIGPTTGSGALVTHLAPGTYHYISSADQVATRRLLGLQLAPSAARTVYDPKAKLLAIEPNRTYSKTWVESAGRPEDVYTLPLPARIRLQFRVTDGMLYRVLDSSGAEVFSGTGGELGVADLGPGTLRISVKSEEVDNLKDYKILVETSDLYEGAVRALTNPPLAVPVSIAKAGTVELWSYGTTEAEAFLRDSSGNTVARSEVIRDDWNFRIVAKLQPGRYTLQLIAPGAAVPAFVAPSAPGTGTKVTFDRIATVNPPGPGTPIIQLSSRAGINLGASSGSLETSREIASEVLSTAFTPKTAGVFRFDAVSDVPVSASVSRNGRTIATGVCPVFLPLAAGTAYDVQFWHSGTGSRKIVLRIVQDRVTDVTVGATEVSVDARDGVVRVASALAAGFTILPEAPDGILYSPGVNEAFTAVTTESVGTVSGQGWVVRRDGSSVGRLVFSPLVLGKGDARAFRVGAVPQSYAVTVPRKTVAIMRTENAGRYVGISAAPAAAFKAGLFDWRGTAVTTLTSAVGLREGSFRGLVWDAAVFTGVAPEGRAGVSASLYPVATEKALGLGQRVQASVAPGTSLSFTLASTRQSVKVSLEAGMAAFVWTAGRPGGFLDARAQALTGELPAVDGSIVVVNQSAREGICVVEASVSPAQVAITDAAPFEAVLAGPRAMSFSVTADKSARLYLWGADAAARFLREDDGRIYTGEASTTDFGQAISFPAGRGVLEVTAASPLRIWSAKPAGVAAGFVGRTTPAKTTALGAGGAVLGQAPDAWTFTLAKDGIVSLSAETGGITAVYNKAGALVSAAAGERSRTLLASLRSGAYTVFTRPLKGGTQSGTIRLQVLAPETLAADGEGPTVLIGPREKKLYRFEVKVEGKVGAGIRTDRDDLVATLLDGGFRRLDSGSIFIRSLAPGVYYLLVESPDSTVRFSPLVYGLAGSRTATPDDVIRTYRQE
jgi:hypothetical protein